MKNKTGVKNGVASVISLNIFLNTDSEPRRGALDLVPVFPATVTVEFWME